MSRYGPCPVEIESLARQRSKTAIETLFKIMTNVDTPPGVRVAAAQVLLDRGWGKPKQSVDATVTHRYVIEVPNLLSDAEWERHAQSLTSDRNLTSDGSDAGRRQQNQMQVLDLPSLKKMQ